MELKGNFFKNTYSNIQEKLPPYVVKSMKKLIPFYMVSSLFEIIGLVVLLPVINVIIDSSIIDRNPYLKILYTHLGFISHIKFAVFLLCLTTFVFVIKNLILYFISKIQNTITFNLARRLSYDKYNSYLEKDYEFHAENNSAVLLRNMTQIPFELVIYVIQPFILLLNEIFILFLIVMGVAFYDPMLFLTLFLFVLPFLYLYNKIFRIRLREISKRRDEEGAKMYKMGLQSMENYREIIVSNKKHFFKPLFKNALDTFANSMRSVSELNLLTPRLVETIAILSIFIIFTTGFLLKRDITSLAQFLILFSIASYRMIPSINKLIQCSNYIKSSFFVFDYFNKSDFQASDSIQNDPIQEKVSFKKTIELRNLSFHYKNHPKPVLNNLHLSIEKGDIIGIIGSSGSGKSTLLSILLRLYIESDGGLYVDQVKINTQNILAWYNVLSFVPQNIVLLDGTILENIAFGVPRNQVDYEKLNRVVKQAQIEDFILSAPNGLHSEIGEKGIKISGGQRQRIGIARALYQESELLIFDEATSALDLETERMLTDSIHNISHSNLTMIIVAHRLETLKYCTKIFKLEEGKLIAVNHTQIKT